MIKKLFTLFLFISYLSFSQSLGLIKTDLNSRKSPGGEKLRIVKKGQIVEIIQSKGSWSFVNDISVNKKGWVSKKYIIKNIAILKTDANSRKSPGGKKLRVIKKGQIVEIIKSKGSWSFVNDLSADKKGWVSTSLLSKNRNFKKIKNNDKTVVVSNVPNCDYRITSPNNGERNVKTNPTIIKWTHATGSPKGYYFSIAKISNDKFVYVKNKNGLLINKLDIGFVSSFSISKLEANTQYFIGLIPYNNKGEAEDCDGFFSFTTGSQTNNNSIDSEKIIEKRLTNMGILWKWKNFKQNKRDRIYISDIGKFINTVNSYKGVPYTFSGTSRNGIDCSGLIYRGLQSVGYTGERLNAQMWAQSGGLISNKNSLRVGDLVAFTNTIRGKRELIHHIGIYVGNNQFLHSSSSKGVIFSDINDPFYWGDKFIFGVRLTR